MYLLLVYDLVFAFQFNALIAAPSVAPAPNVLSGGDGRLRTDQRRGGTSGVVHAPVPFWFNSECCD